MHSSLFYVCLNICIRLKAYESRETSCSLIELNFRHVLLTGLRRMFRCLKTYVFAKSHFMDILWLIF